MRKAGRRYALQMRGFEAVKNNRFTNDWVAENSSINKQVKAALPSLRDRARDLWKNDDLIKGYSRRVRANTVFEGFKLQMRVKDANGTPDDKANSLIEEKWKKWTGKKYCTMEGRLDFTRMLWLIVDTLKCDGEVLVRSITGKDVNEFGYSLELIESDLLDHNYNEVLNNGNVVIMGIELDQWKRRVAYYFKSNSLENEMSGLSYSSINNTTLKRIPAEEIIHIFDPKFLKQFRGTSELASGMLTLHSAKGYDEAAIITARAGASKSIYIEQEKDLEHTGDEEDSDGNQLENLSYGEVNYLNPGEKIAPWDPTYPHDQYPHFVKAIRRKLAVGLGVNYNLWLGDLEGVNFSSLRAGTLDERDHWRMDQYFLIDALCKEVFEGWLKWSLLTRVVNLAQSKFDIYNKPEFIPRSWPWVDPYKDVQASALAIDKGLSTLTRELKKQGLDFDDYITERKRELEKLKEAGITIGEQMELAPPKEDDEEKEVILDLFQDLLKNNGNGNGNGHKKKTIIMEE